MATTEQVTKLNATVVDKDGNAKSVEYLSEDKYKEVAKEATDAGGACEISRQQTFTITEAASLEEAATLFPKRALEFLNYGARLAQQNVMRDFMRDEDWQPVEGSYDLLPEIQEPKERKKASPREKAINLLAKIAKDAGKEVDREAIEAILAQFMPADAEATA